MLATLKVVEALIAAGVVCAKCGGIHGLRPVLTIEYFLCEDCGEEEHQG